jgi:hypothetical protein
MNLGFSLQPSDPIQPGNPMLPLDISFFLTFNPDSGVLLDVEVMSMSVPAP